MRTSGAASLYSIFLYISCATTYVFSRPMKVFSKGFSGKHLPPGGWTHWFNIDHPDGAGDFETYASIVRLYGRNCMGIPCRKPIAVKAETVYGLRPAETGNQVRITARRGISCYSSHQHNSECADYRVRFYCRNLHIKCSRSKFYPQHWDQYRSENSTGLTNISTDDNIFNEQYQKKLKVLEKKLLQKKETLEDYGLHKEVNEVVARKRKRRKRKNRKRSHQKRRTSQEKEPRDGPPVLAYHPRHPRFL